MWTSETLIIAGKSTFPYARNAPRSQSRESARLAANGARVALSGRDRGKLEALKRDLGVDWPVLVVDTADAREVEALARSTGAVASAVGSHSLPLAAACARTGTSYADLSGEVPFVRQSITELHESAGSTGARIVHACGFDAVPSDLSTFLLDDRVRVDGQGTLTDTLLVVESLKGGFSAATWTPTRLKAPHCEPTRPFKQR